jgi:plastocyanin
MSVTLPSLLGVTRTSNAARWTYFLLALLVFGRLMSQSQELSPNQRQIDSQKRTANLAKARNISTASSSPASKLWEVHILHSHYNDDLPLKIVSGDSVVWINDDDMQHTATSTSGKVQFNTGYLQPGQRSRPITFLAETDPNGVTYSCQVHDGMNGQLIVSSPVATPQAFGAPKETLSTHSFVVFGTDTMYLHHIALFQDANHQYEVTLEGVLDDPAAQKAYQAYRKQYGDELTVIDPEYFILSELDTGKHTSFHANFFRKKWELPIDGLQGVVVRVKRKILFRHFSPSDNYPPRLTYQLVGSAREAFLIHRIAAAPNFQEVIKLAKVPEFLDAESIACAPDLFVVDKAIETDDTYALRVAVLSNGTHILLGPPPRTLSPTPPTADGEELTIQLANETETHKVVAKTSIYFDVQILNR